MKSVEGKKRFSSSREALAPEWGEGGDLESNSRSVCDGEEG